MKMIVSVTIAVCMLLTSSEAFNFNAPIPIQQTRLSSRRGPHCSLLLRQASPHSEFEENNDEINNDARFRYSVTTRKDILKVLASIVGLSSANTLSASAIDNEPATTSNPGNDSYKVKLTVQLDTKAETQSEIIIEVRPDWAPIASNRFKELVEIGFYDGSRFFRVLPSYVAQFGIAADPKLNKEWIFCEKGCRALEDEPRVVPNKKGTLSFASSGKNSRQTQVFINLSNNAGPPNFLDAQNFVPFAQVMAGMDDIVPKLNSEYGLTESLSAGLAGSVNQGKAAYYGEEYLSAVFPKLSIIKKAEIINN